MEKIFSIVEYTGIIYLEDCGVVPLKYHAKKDEIERLLLDRGLKFASLVRGKQHKVYAGPVDKVEVYRRRPAEPKFSNGDEPFEVSFYYYYILNISIPPLRYIVINDNIYQIRSDIIIDTITYNRLHSHAAIRVNIISHELVDSGGGERLTKAHLMICTDRIPFFSLQDKHWHKGNIANIEDKVFNERIFTQLVLPDATKQLVRALVRNHTNKGTAGGFDDFVKGQLSTDRKSTRLNSSHCVTSRMPSSA